MSYESQKVVCSTHEEFLEERKASEGASDVAKILGLNPLCSQMKHYAYRKGQLPTPAAEDNIVAKRRGHALEPLATTLYSEATGRTLIHEPFTLYRVSLLGIHASPDRLIAPVDDDDMTGCLEAKSVGWRMAKHWDDGVPLYTQVQLQIQMFCTGCCWGEAAPLFEDEFRHYPVTRNDKFIAWAIDAVQAFRRCLENDTPPEPTGDETDALRLLYPKHEPGKMLQLTDEAAEWTAVIEAAKAKRAEAEEQIKAYESKLKAKLGDAERGTLPDGTGWTWREQAGRLVEAHDVAPYRVLRRTLK